MSKSTRNIFALALLFGVMLIALYGYGVYFVQQKGAAFLAARQAFAEQTAKEAAYTNLLRIIEESRDDRALVGAYFLTEQDTISLITNIEQIARRLGLVFETTQLAVAEQPGGSNQELDVALRFTGAEADVRTFIQYLETLPYQKSLNSIGLLGAADTQDWRGQVSLSFTLVP